MCLNLTEDSEIKVAEENIICYKVVRRLQPGVYGSEFHSYIYKMGALNTLNSILDINKFPVNTYPTTYPNTCASICDGHDLFIEVGFHSFICKEDAYEYKDYSHSYSSGILYRVVKCIIPKGANYIEGTYIGYPNYASDKIICLEEI